jgi:hypothetical protein
LTDLADRKGIPRSINFGLGFFYALDSMDLLTKQEVGMRLTEQVQLRLTILAVRDWDSFQAALWSMRCGC